MFELTVHTPDSAPEGSRAILEGAQRAMGFVPNLYGVFAGAPAALTGYTGLGQAFEQSSFSATERQVVLLAASAENGCEYCMAAHSTLAAMQQVAPDVVEALRDLEPLTDPKLEALRTFTLRVVQDRGRVPQDAIGAFLAAGYGQAQVLEVVLGVAMKTLSNYTNHLASTPLDAAFEPRAWRATAKQG